MKTSKEVEEVCKKLKPVIGNKADRLWYLYLAEDEKGRKKLALDIEIIAEKLLKKDALTNPKILLNPSSINDASGSILLGDIVYNHKKLHSLYLRGIEKMLFSYYNSLAYRLLISSGCIHR